MTFRNKLLSMWYNLQYTLFPDLIKRSKQDLCPEYKKLIAILELLRIENNISLPFAWEGHVKIELQWLEASLLNLYLKSLIQSS